MPYKRFVQPGRVAYIADGPLKGKICAIVDVINQTQVLVDGPQSGVPRGSVRLSQIQLTKFRLDFPYTATTRIVRKAWNEFKLDEKWKESAWYRKLEAKKRRAAMTDFDRFRLGHARKVRRGLRTQYFYQLRGAKKRACAEKAKLKKLGLYVKPGKRRRFGAPATEGKEISAKPAAKK